LKVWQIVRNFHQLMTINIPEADRGEVILGMKLTTSPFRGHRAAKCRILLPGLLAAMLLVYGCSQEPDAVLHGYAEGDFVLIAPPLAGRLEELWVQRGDQVQVGDLLFVLDHVEEQAAVAVAEQEVMRAASRLEDLRKGQRPSELRAIEARVEQARANLDLAGQEFARRRALRDQEAISVEEYERAMATLNMDRAALADLEAQLETARLGARRDAVAAGQAELDAARAGLDQARWALAEKSQHAAQAGLVFDTLFEAGEFVRAGYPVVSLLPPGNIKIRFFVPEPLVGSLRIDQPVKVSFDNSQGPLPATISFISPRAEYTPPVIYSREARAKLVFLVEAYPDPSVATRFHPGQPVDVFLESSHE
jgi:HlyD family secretion protein